MRVSMGKNTYSNLIPIITFIVGFYALCVTGCGNNEEEESGTAPATGVTYDENGFVTNGAGTLRIAMVGTGASGSNSGLRLATEPSDPDQKYFSNEYTLGGRPDDLTIYVTKMTLKRDDAPEGEEREIPIFLNNEGRPLRITGRTVDMSNFFTVIKCYGEDGTVFAEECPCGVDADGEIIAAVPYIDENGTEKESCPSGDSEVIVEKNPVSFINVSQTGTFTKLAVTYKSEAAVKGCVEGYMQQTGYTPQTPTENVAWERFCTKTGKGSNAAAAGTANTSSSFLDPTFTAEAELSDFRLSAQSATNAEYLIKGGVTITEDGEGPQITMVIDTSSMLRFFKDDNYNNRVQPEFEGWAGSYFYVRNFGAQNFVFVGQPGSIRGFSVEQTLVEQDDQGNGEPSGSAANPAAYDECSQDLSSCIAKAKGRLSLIYDSTGNPMLFNLNFSQGSGIDVTNTSRDGIDATTITADESLSGTYKFNLSNTDDNNDTQTTDIYQINFDAAVGETFNAYGSQKTTGTNTGWFWGRLRMTREF